MNMEMKKELFSKALVNDRLAKGLSQQVLADELQVAQQSLSKWESGINFPRDYRIIRIGEYFGPGSETAAFAEEIKKSRNYKISGRSGDLGPPSLATLITQNPDPHAIHALNFFETDVSIPELPEDAFEAMSLLRSLPIDKRRKFTPAALKAAFELGRAYGALHKVMKLMEDELSSGNKKEAETDR